MNLKYKDNNHIFNEKENNDVPFLSFEVYDKIDWLINGISTRYGGVSSGYLSSLNFSDTVNDSNENLIQNFTNLGNAIGVNTSDMVCSDQTHTTNLLVVDNTYKKQGVLEPRNFHDIDGLMTNVPGICLITTYADCVPLFFVDPIKRVIALSHSGWKGTVHQIGKITINKLIKQYGCNPSDIICAIGPSICQDCYEVSEDVIIEFKKSYDKKYWNDIFYKKSNNKYQLNLWNACKITLLNSGIKEENLTITNLCTCCNPKELFSHRASKGKRGNISCFLYIKNQ